MILTDANVFVDGFEMQSEMNALSVDPSKETKEDTAFGQNTRSFVPGLKTVAMNVSGICKQVNEANLSDIDNENVVVTFSDENSEGAVAYSFKSSQSSYNKSFTHGELVEFSFDAFATNDMVRGYIASIEKNVTTDGVGSALNLGAITSGQKLYASLHVLSVSDSDSLDVDIEMDATGAFSGSESVVASFNTASLPTSEWVEVEGPLTGDYFRAVHAVTGTDVSIDYVLFLAVK